VSDRAMAAYERLSRKRHRPLWSVSEQRIVLRFAGEFIQGRHRSVLAAARPCKRSLDQLHAEHANAVWASAPRTLRATGQRLAEALKEHGNTWSGVDFLSPETALLDRYARRFVEGRYRHLVNAARDCWRALKRRTDRIRRKYFGLLGTPAPRTRKAVASQLEMRSRALGRLPLARDWSAAEVRTVDKWTRRYVSALEKGTGPSQSEVLDAMARELEIRGHPPRPAAGYRGMFEKRLRTTPVGRSRPGRRWTPADIETARRWVRVYLAARRGGAEFLKTEAAGGLRAELARNGRPRTQRGCESIIERLVKAARRKMRDSDFLRHNGALNHDRVRQDRRAEG